MGTNKKIVLSELDADLQKAVQETRERVAKLHGELIRWGLVVWTAGNVSERVVLDRGQGPEKTDLFVIKPSGVAYEELCADNMVVCTLDGEKIDDGTPDNLSPSSDTAAVAYVFRHMEEVGGVVHTHSTYATAWAARHEPVPCALTMMGDEFGGEIPIGPFALIGDDSIGKGIVETLKDSKSPAVLMANHGPFVIGKNARAAVKAAAMCEEVARTIHIARQGGEIHLIPQDLVDSLNDRYQNVYGQH